MESRYPTEKEKTLKAPTWDLESIFPGGSNSSKYTSFRESIRNDMKRSVVKFFHLPQKLNDSNRPKWIDYIVKLQELMARIVEADDFVHCLVSQNVADEKAIQIYGEIDIFRSEFQKLLVSLEAFAKKQSNKEWGKLVASKRLSDAAFFLNELREIAKIKMAPEFESFAADLAVNGYHAWNRLYDKIYGDMRIDFHENGETKKLSLGQLANKMNSQDRDIRRLAFHKLEEAWESSANVASMALNFQAGFRLSLYEKRKWDSPLLEPLLNSRIKPETLDAMWHAVAKGVPKIKQYIDAKKKLLGLDKFCWYDQSAPIGKSAETYTFDEAGEFIISNLAGFSREMADFSKMALQKRWIEAEDRPGKAGGGFCTSFQVSKQSRIFMTWGGNFSALSTLAHELGHAYHHSTVQDIVPFAAIYPMTLAETASTFNELLVTDAALRKSTNDGGKLMLLDQKLQNTHTLFCNIYARFLFDKAFYKERGKGLVSKTRLNEIMVESQKTAFAGTLDPDEGYHPYFWASKLHFFMTDTPFYNFPYTFGFLFAAGIYNRAKNEGSSFAPHYRALLADSGRMTSEQVAMKHLGVDITKSDFWNEAVERALADIDPFVKLAGKA